MQDTKTISSKAAKITTKPVLVAPQHINLDLKATSQNEAIFEVARMLENVPAMKDFDHFCSKLIAREGAGSTYLSKGIALPHARTNGVDQILIAIGVSKEGLQFTGQNSPVRIVIVIATPKDQISGYLATVGMLARILRKEDKVAELLNCKSPHEFSQLFPSDTMVGTLAH